MARHGRAFPSKGVWLSRKPIAAAGSNKTISADAGSYLITGTAVTLKHAWVVGVNSGSYAITGTSATGLHGWKVAVASGSYAISGTAASLLHGWKIAAAAGSYAITGTSVALNKGQRITADAGSYSITGATASLLHGWRVGIDSGSYSITGSNADLTLTTASAQTQLPEVSWPLSGVNRKQKRKIDDEYRARVYAEIAGELEEAISHPKPAKEFAKVRRKAGFIAPAADESDELESFIALLQPSTLDAERALDIARSLEYRARLLVEDEDAIIALLLA